jgi:hypothetical protein
MKRRLPDRVRSLMMRTPLTAALLLTLVGCKEPPPVAPDGRATEPPVAAMPASESTTTLQVGDAAPEFALPAADGSTVRLADAVADGPAIIVFYRGDW